MGTLTHTHRSARCSPYALRGERRSPPWLQKLPHTLNTPTQQSLAASQQQCTRASSSLVEQQCLLDQRVEKRWQRQQSDQQRRLQARPLQQKQQTMLELHHCKGSRSRKVGVPPHSPDAAVAHTPGVEPAAMAVGLSSAGGVAGIVLDMPRSSTAEKAKNHIRTTVERQSQAKDTSCPTTLTGPARRVRHENLILFIGAAAPDIRTGSDNGCVMSRIAGHDVHGRRGGRNDPGHAQEFHCGRSNKSYPNGTTTKDSDRENMLCHCTHRTLQSFRQRSHQMTSPVRGVRRVRRCGAAADRGSCSGHTTGKIVSLPPAHARLTIWFDKEIQHSAHIPFRVSSSSASSAHDETLPDHGHEPESADSLVTLPDSSASPDESATARPAARTLARFERTKPTDRDEKSCQAASPVKITERQNQCTTHCGRTRSSCPRKGPSRRPGAEGEWG